MHMRVDKARQQHDVVTKHDITRLSRPVVLDGRDPPLPHDDPARSLDVVDYGPARSEHLIHSPNLPAAAATAQKSARPSAANIQVTNLG
jgi:hypothetical protein